MRSSCMSVSENESRICFAVINDTPPCVYRTISENRGLRNQGGRSDDDIPKRCQSPREFWKIVSGKRERRPSIGRLSHRPPHLTRVLLNAPDEASCPERSVRGCKSRRYYPTTRSDCQPVQS